MRLNCAYHNSHSGALCLLIALLFLASCSSSISPTSTKAPAAPATATPAPAATSSPTAEPVSTNPTAEAVTLITESTKNLHYADVDEVTTELDVVAPVEPGPWPVVIVAHGLSQRRHTFVRLSEAIASEGAVVYNIDVKFTFPYLTGIERIACAVRYARATAADYGGDPGRITLVGNSAGAATGSVVALAGDDFEGDCVVNDGSALLDALVAFEGPYYYATTADLELFDHTILKDEDPELWEAINPYSHIGLNPDLQVRLVHGIDVDNVWWEVTPEVSIEFHQALADAGYDVELILVEGASHTALTISSSDAFALVVQQVMELARSSSQ